MTKILRFAIIIWTTFVGLALPTQSLARLYVPSSFAILSDDAQLLLVMRSPVKIEWDEGRIFKLPSGQEINLREKFTTNGVFRLDTFECVQPLNWFADDGELFASGDLSLLVRLNRFGSDDKWCLKFYNKGKEIKQYKVGDLVQLPYYTLLPFDTYGYHPMWYVMATYTDSSEFYVVRPSYSSFRQFILVTAPQSLGHLRLSDGNVFLFNATTGEIVQEWRHHPLIKLCLIAVLFLGLLLLFIFFVVRKLWKSFRRKTNKPDQV